MAVIGAPTRAGRVLPSYAPAGPAGLRRYLGLTAGYLGQYVRGRLEYRADLLSGVLSEVFTQAISLTFLAVLFTHVPALAGWSHPEVYVMYAFFQLSWGLADSCAGGVWGFGERYIARGELDRLLLRPAAPLFQLLLEGVDLESFLQVGAGVVILLWAMGAAHVHWRWWMPPLIALWTATGAAIFLGVFLALTCAAFWVDGRTGVMPLVYNTTAYGRYPVTIYGRWLRILFSYLLPFAFVAFYPAAALLRPAAYVSWGVGAVPAAAATCAVAALVWTRGLRRYQGTGS